MFLFQFLPRMTKFEQFFSDVNLTTLLSVCLSIYLSVCLHWHDLKQDNIAKSCNFCAKKHNYN